MNRKTHRIVLTGGPGGGKTTAADLIRREQGDDIVIVPESATILFSGGFPRSDSNGAKAAAQKAIFHVQRNMEDVQHALYPGRVLLCDRGTVDGSVYWPHGEDEYFKQMETTLEEEFARYDAVLFFETAAVGNLAFEGGNPIRIENNAKAIELDKALNDVWSQHPRFFHIPHQKSFFKKIECAYECLQKAINTLNGDG